MPFLTMWCSDICLFLRPCSNHPGNTGTCSATPRATSGINHRCASAEKISTDGSRNQNLRRSTLIGNHQYIGGLKNDLSVRADGESGKMTSVDSTVPSAT